MWNAVDGAPDANIGAGLLVLFGWALLGVGLVLSVVMLVVAHRGQRVSSGGARR